MSAATRPSGHRGLSQAEAQARLVVHGPNALPQARPTRLWWRFLDQFRSPLIYILLFALALDLAIWLHAGADHVPHESIAIAAILLLNAALGTWQESKAEAALSRLKALAAPLVWVVRDGVLTHVLASALVPGDVARVEAGDRVPADGHLVDGQNVMTDESILTGEALPVDKALGDDLSSGTLLVRGMGYIEVTRTGAMSAMGRLATMIGGIEAGQTPLERRLAEFGNLVAIAILGVGLVLTLGGIVVEGIGRIGQVALFSVALAVAAVPEGLPAVLTSTLALGVERLARRKAIVRRLSAVEALGSVTVIATDKTGTLTENRMQVRALDTPDEARALHAMVLVNDAEPATRIGDPLEVALLDHAAACGTDVESLVSSRPRLSMRAFDSNAKFMRVTVSEDGQPVSYLKGAPEVLLERSAFSAQERREWDAKALGYAREGYRVIALAWGLGESESGVTFVGLVMMWDPPRPEVKEALQRTRSAGIRVLMITGDHPATAEAVARVIGIASERVITGAEIQRMPPGELRDTVAHVGVFARMEPEHKLRLVEALKANGEIVAVTGDGINDAPALKRSDVGIAMGLRGSDVSREVADVVLMDDNFATIVTAIEEGRSIYENIQKFIRFFFSTDLALILLAVMGLCMAFVLGLKDPDGGTFLLPLTAAQLLWINVVADGPPALALAVDRNPGVMTRPPRPPSSRLLDAPSLRFIALSGVVKAAVGVCVLGVMPFLGCPLNETRSALFVYESMLQLVFAYPSRRISVVPLPNLWIHLAVGLGLLLQASTVLLAPLRDLLGLVPLSATVMAVILLAVAATWAIAETAGNFTRLTQSPENQS